MPIFRASRLAGSELMSMYALGEAYWLAGEFDKARQTLEELLEIADHRGARYYSGCTHRLLGEVTTEINPTEAAPHFERSIALLREINAENELAKAYAAYGRLYRQQGNIAQGREYLTKALDIFDRLGTLIEPERVRQELAELAKG